MANIVETQNKGTGAVTKWELDDKMAVMLETTDPTMPSGVKFNLKYFWNRVNGIGATNMLVVEAPKTIVQDTKALEAKDDEIAKLKAMLVASEKNEAEGVEVEEVEAAGIIVKPKVKAKPRSKAK